MVNIVDVLTHLSKEEIATARAEVLQALKGCKDKTELRNVGYSRREELNKICEKYNLGKLKIETIGDMGFVYIEGAPLTAFGVDSK